MARTPFAPLFARLRPPDAYPGDAAADAELLRRYAEARDPAAFELLVWRHGPLVLGICRRVARDEADAEDAFQATFLILARKAATVRQSLPGWLHRTARRAAVRAARRRRLPTLTADVPAATRPALDADELAVLDAAIDGLGERHRRVVVLCYLQGHSTDAAATILGVPRGTVLSRLATARARLAATLTRRGLTLPTAVAASALSFDRVTACVELTLNPRAAAPAAAIAQGVLTMILRHQLAATAVALTLVGVGLTGTGVALMPRPGGDGPPVPAAVVPPIAKAVDKPSSESPELVAERKKSQRIQSIILAIDGIDKEIDNLRNIMKKVETMSRSDTINEYTIKSKAQLVGQVEVAIFDLEIESQKLIFKSDALEFQAKSLKNEAASSDLQANVKSTIKSEKDDLRAQIEFKSRLLNFYRKKQISMNQEFNFYSENLWAAELKDELRKLKARREFLENQLMMERIGMDIHTSSPDPKLDRVLSELIDLRAEVKRLRDGK